MSSSATKRRQKPHSSPERGPTPSRPSSKDFQRELEEKKQAHLHAVNEKFHSAFKKATKDNDVDTLRRLALEYRAIVWALERRFGGNSQCSVVSFGSNDCYQLGLSEEQREKVENEAVDLGPVQTGIGSCVRAVAAGGLHSVILTNYGVPYSWGSSDEGQVGHTLSNATGSNPEPVTKFSMGNGESESGTITQIAAGDAHTMFLTLAGNVYTCGLYKDSDSLLVRDQALAEDIFSFNKTPVHVPFMNGQKVRDIAAGGSMSVAITEDGTLYTWGMGNTGNLARSEMMAAPDNDGNYDLTSYGFGYRFEEPNEDGEVYNKELIKEHFLTPKAVCWNTLFNRRLVISVAVGSDHIVASATCPQGYGQVFTSGLNGYGQLGHGDTKSRHEMTLVESLKDKHVTLVAAGKNHTLVCVFGTNLLYSCGETNDGQLGIGFPSRTEQRVLSFQPVLFPDPVVVVHIEAKENQSFALTECHDYAETDGLDCWAWGTNRDRVLGHPNTGKHESMHPQDEFYFRPVKLDVSGVSGNSNWTARIFGISAGPTHTFLMTQNFKK